MTYPRRTIALGPPYDDGRVPAAPVLSDEERLDRIEKKLERLADTVAVLASLRGQPPEASDE